jgi:hypothetical protein
VQRVADREERLSPINPLRNDLIPILWYEHIGIYEEQDLSHGAARCRIKCHRTPEGQSHLDKAQPQAEKVNIV